MNAENPKNPADIINSPPHYTGENGMEAIDVIEAFDLGFNLGNVVKYVLRAGKKGDRTEDLKKAAWYLNREITKKRFAWQKAAMGGYKILKDRIGIRITTHNPNNFNVGPTTLEGSPYRLGVRHADWFQTIDHPDAEFIESAPSDVAYLLECVDTLQARVAELEAAMGLTETKGDQA